MTSRRPTLPLGYSLAGLPEVQNIVHADDKCELYALKSSGAAEPHLMLLRSDRGSPDIEQMIRWWTTQWPDILTIIGVLKSDESPAHTRGVALSLQGKSIKETALQTASAEGLRELFLGMLDLIERVRDVGMYPDFEPTLCWQSTDGSKIAALFPLDGVRLTEADLVQLAAKAFYRLATGIDTSKVSELPPLFRWAKFGGEQLSNTVSRCLTTGNPKIRITTLGAVYKALGRTANNEDRQKASTDQKTIKSSDIQQGLDLVAGMHILKQLLIREVVNPIRNPEPYLRYGLSIPNGILLYGPPGCGKTYIARHLAEELGLYFLELIPSELASPYIHQSVIKIREVFASAAEHAPSVLFIDEFEALVPSRSELSGHQQYKSEEVNEFLAHLNECSAKKIFVIAATNEPQKIDAAVRRTGRLDKLIYVGPPDEEARREMLSLHMQGRPISGDLSVEALAQNLDGYSASDIRFLVDEAAREALHNNAPISLQFFQSAMHRVPPSISPDSEAKYRTIQQRGL
jgi:AAA+ superfamily predicted ATPase